MIGKTNLCTENLLISEVPPPVFTGGPFWTRIEHYASRQPRKFEKSLNSLVAAQLPVATTECRGAPHGGGRSVDASPSPLSARPDVQRFLKKRRRLV
jgi:hypothetical protein